MINKKVLFAAIDEDSKKQYFVADTVQEIKKAIKESKDAPKTLKIYKVKVTCKYRLLNV